MSFPLLTVYRNVAAAFFPLSFLVWPFRDTITSFNKEETAQKKKRTLAGKAQKVVQETNLDFKGVDNT